MFTQKLMSIRDAARVLGVPEKTLYHYCLHGTVPSVRLGGRRLVPVEAVQAIVRGEVA